MKLCCQVRDFREQYLDLLVICIINSTMAILMTFQMFIPIAKSCPSFGIICLYKPIQMSISISLSFTLEACFGVIAGIFNMYAYPVYCTYHLFFKILRSYPSNGIS
ncbi:hypothetical protein E2542_SST19750 [Spatholobus suberectus]|nr:hypothetical protein E2542_SST19750 [Spatholobus suberectus]